MNLVRLEERLKDLSEDQLREAFPKGIIPQFLIMSELNRRKEVKDEYQRSQAEQGTTVAEDLLTVTDGPMAVGMERMGVMAQPQNRMEMQPGNLPVDQSMAAMPPMPMMPQEAPALPDPEPMRMQPGGLAALSSSSPQTVLDAILEQRKREEAERKFRQFGLADETGRPLAMVDPVPEEFRPSSDATLASQQAALGLSALEDRERRFREIGLADETQAPAPMTEFGGLKFGGLKFGGDRIGGDRFGGEKIGGAIVGGNTPRLPFPGQPGSEELLEARAIANAARRIGIETDQAARRRVQQLSQVRPGLINEMFTRVENKPELRAKRKSIDDQLNLIRSGAFTEAQKARDAEDIDQAGALGTFAPVDFIDTQDRPGIADAMRVFAANANTTSSPVVPTVPQQTSVGQSDAGQPAVNQSAQMIDTGTSIASDPNLMSSTLEPLGMSKINFELLDTNPAINDAQINTQAYLTNQVASTQAALKDSKSAFKEFEDDLKKMKEGLGDKKDRAVGLALLEAGLRIAGSQSPNLSGAIGEAAPALQTFTKSLDQIDDDRKNIINSKLKLVQAQQAELRGKKDDAREALRDARQFNKDIQDREEKIEQRKAKNAEIRARIEDINIRRSRAESAKEANALTREFNTAKLEILRNDIDNQIAVFTGRKLSLLNDPKATKEQKESVEDTLKTLTRVKRDSTGKTYNANLNSLTKILGGFDKKIEAEIDPVKKQELIREKGLYQGAYDQLISGGEIDIPRRIPLIKPKSSKPTV